MSSDWQLVVVVFIFLASACGDVYRQDRKVTMSLLGSGQPITSRFDMANQNDRNYHTVNSLPHITSTASSDGRTDIIDLKLKNRYRLGGEAHKKNILRKRGYYNGLLSKKIVQRSSRSLPKSVIHNNNSNCLYCTDGILRIKLGQGIGFICSKNFPSSHPSREPCAIIFDEPVVVLLHEFYVEYQDEVSIHYITVSFNICTLFSCNSLRYFNDLHSSN